jgi:hypothetical protein
MTAIVAGATQHAPTEVLEAAFSVSLAHGGATETWKVTAKLTPDGSALEALVVESPRNRIEFPSKLIVDLDRPDLRKLHLSTIEPDVYLYIAYGSVGSTSGQQPCPFRETRFQAEYRIHDGRVVEPYFRSPDEGILPNLEPGVVPRNLRSSYD